jgi:hypothetical protein
MAAVDIDELKGHVLPPPEIGEENYYVDLATDPDYFFKSWVYLVFEREQGMDAGDTGGEDPGGHVAL